MSQQAIQKMQFQDHREIGNLTNESPKDFYMDRDHMDFLFSKPTFATYRIWALTELYKLFYSVFYL